MRFGFNLTNSFTRDSKVLSDLFQRVVRFFTDTEPHSKNFFFPVVSGWQVSFLSAPQEKNADGRIRWNA
jgi:hypothetical protein